MPGCGFHIFQTRELERGLHLRRRVIRGNAEVSIEIGDAAVWPEPGDEMPFADAQENEGGIALHGAGELHRAVDFILHQPHAQHAREFVVRIFHGLLHAHFELALVFRERIVELRPVEVGP